jgi:Meckel syndrome type 1 protein
MNTPLPPDHDDDLPGEAELAALYRKLPKSEPGPALDAAVLRAAAEALASGNEQSPTAATQPQRRSSRTRWLIPLSSAATLVLAAGLAWHMRSMPVAESAMTKAEAPQIAAPVSAPSVAAVPVASPPAAAPPSPPPPAQVGPAGVLSEVTHTAPPPAPQARVPERLVARSSVMKPKKAADKVAATDAVEDATVGRYASAHRAPPSPEPSQNYASANAFKVAAPPPAPEMSLPPPDQAAADSEAETSKVAAAPMAAPVPMAAVTPIAEMAPAAPDVTAKDARDTPVQELEKIRRLFAVHRDDEARTRLEAFQREHADQALPADLRARLSSKP